MNQSSLLTKYSTFGYSAQALQMFIHVYILSTAIQLQTSVYINVVCW